VNRIELIVVGVVQGVGFRPFVRREASARGLSGSVRNSPGGVRISVQGPPSALDAFVRAVVSGPDGRGGTIKRLVDRPLEAEAGFAILASEPSASAPARASLPPDLAPCAACRAEIAGPGRRCGYAFTSCTRCGPRSSIAVGAPWDRENTTMAAFALCPACSSEYADAADRRGHAQTIACPACGPRLWLERRGERIADGDAALATAVAALAGGAILGLKGVGGWQLIVDATDEAAVAELRRRKRRDARPFAVLFQDLPAIERACIVHAAERRALLEPAAPIVLVRTRAPSELAPSVAPTSRLTGAMLGASPLHLLLAAACARPLVCTSGNLSDEPLCVDDGDARDRLGGLADVLLGHDRAIARPLDDSVVRITPVGGVVVRRARGYAPRALRRHEPGPSVLALGAHLKTTVALALADEIWLSAHVGDLGSPVAIDRLASTAREMLAAAGIQPEVVACDLHPALASTALAERLAHDTGAALIRVPHHAAHVAAVVAEHALTGPVLGFAWDGMGLGDDGALWGGEAIVLDGVHATRVAHLRPFSLPGNEAAIREPRRAALGVLAAVDLPHDAAAAWFAPAELAIVEAALARRVNTPVTTSVGRLFDAVAALVGLRGRSRFEAEAAMELEQVAIDEPLDVEPYPVAITGRSPWIIDWRPTIVAILGELRGGTPVARIAARFHAALADAAAAIAVRSAVRDVALCGGCFLNARLLATVTQRLEAHGVTVWTPRELPPGDGAISVGQTLLASRRSRDVSRDSR